ncbi:twin-arginine translocation signal domain-containing protein [Arthrobacter globiformis]
MTTRRSFVVRAGALTAAAALSACSGVNMDRQRETSLNFVL